MRLEVQLQTYHRLADPAGGGHTPKRQSKYYILQTTDTTTLGQNGQLFRLCKRKKVFSFMGVFAA